MAAVLFLVGQRGERPAITAELLDVRSSYPTKPQYAMADDRPLALVECTFPDIPGWEMSAAATDGLRRCVTARWEALAIETAMTAAGLAASGGAVALRSPCWRHMDYHPTR